MTTTPDTETTANAAVVRAFISDLFTSGDLSAVDRYLDPQIVIHARPMGFSADAEGMRSAAVTLRAACPDWHSDVLHLIAEADLVAEHFVASGTHRGELFGVAPTGAVLTLAGINLFRVRNGRIVEWWPRLDELGMLRQLGLAPVP